MRPAASRRHSVSSAAMSRNRSRNSSAESPATTTSLCGLIRTKPSLSSRRSACITGIRLTPAECATALATIRSPGASRPPTRACRRWR